MGYVLDTNLIKVLLKDDKKVQRIDKEIRTKIDELIFLGEQVFISALSYYETKRGLLHINATTEMAVFDCICRKLGILLLDNLAIFEKASEIWAELKRSGKQLKLSEKDKQDGDADILIAATALRRNLIVVSDDKDFQTISSLGELKIENWLRA